MEEKEKFEANKRSNAPFLRALGVLMKEKNINQAQAAELLNTKSGTFSDYKNGKKRASQEMYDRLARAFGGRLNIHYLTGESEYMLLENVPDEEIIDYTQRELNPDYDLIKNRQQKTETIHTNTLETSFMLEKVLASAINEIKNAKNQTIASLEKQVADKDRQLGEKDKYIAVLEKRIADYEAATAFIQENNLLDKWPFPKGVADEMEKPKSLRV